MNFCALDIGSTRIKASLRDADGKSLIRKTYEYSGENFDSDLEINEQIWQQVRELVLDIWQEHNFRNLIISCQMAGFSAVDTNGKLVAPLIMGVDPRVPLDHGFDLMVSGVPKGGPSTFGILNWLRSKYSTLNDKSIRIGGIKEYVLFCLTGKWVTDPASASSSGFYDLRTGDWCPKTLNEADIEPIQLPQICAMDSVIGTAVKLFPSTKQQQESIEVFCGTGDGPAANISTGAIGEQRACLSKGTTVVLRTLEKGINQKLNYRPHFIQHVRDDWYCSGVRYTYDRNSDSFLSSGDLNLKLTAEQLILDLQETLNHLQISDIRSIGGRNLNLPNSWQVNELGDDYQDGTKGLALVAQGFSLDEIKNVVDNENKLRIT
jgi:sugar (pentulose or hexulose) kinase